MPKRRSLFILHVIFLLLTAFETAKIQAKIHITDDLDDVLDSEEDESWKEWGKKKPANPLGPDLLQHPEISKLYPEEVRAEMMKQHAGPVFGFAKLQPGIRRTTDMVAEIARKWSKIARTGSIDAMFSAFDKVTVMFTMERGQDADELQEFVLSQPEAYEIKIGEKVYRRDGDPPLEEVMEKLRNEENREDHSSSRKEDKHDEL